jgi:hypothetical protein
MSPCHQGLTVRRLKQRKKEEISMNRTARQMIPAIGQTVVVRVEAFHINMVVKDVKQAWGQTRLLVAPINGTGEAWIDCSRCSRCSRGYDAGSAVATL